MELYLILVALELGAGVGTAVLIEGAAKFVGLAFFFIPGQVGASEGAHTIFFETVGLPAVAGFTIPFVRRIRSIVVAGMAAAGDLAAAAKHPWTLKPAEPRQTPATWKPYARAASPSASSCVTITSGSPIRSRQIRAVARCRASSVPRGVASGSAARLNTGGRKSTRSRASSHSPTTRPRSVASSRVKDP